MGADGDETRVGCSSAASSPGGFWGELRRCADPLQATPAVMMKSTRGDELCNGVGRDPMVKIELDAAHALAEFAHVALMASRGVECRRGRDRKWGRRGCRTTVRRRRVEIWGKSFQDFEKAASWQDPQGHFLNKLVQQSRKNLKHLVKENIKIEQHDEFPSADKNLKKAGRHAAFSRGKPKQQLSEAEKEERRLRRIQANRESARQTIRRRQALCEELTKKAADLSLENESIKQEIESAMQEYLSLVGANKRLKEQIAEADEDGTKNNQSQDIKEVPSEDALCKTETMMPSSMRFPLLVCNGTPFAQLAWPSVMQPLDPSQPQPVVHHETSPSGAHTTNFPHRRVSFGGQSGSRPHLFLIPCPLIYPINDQASRPFPSLGLKEGNGGSNNIQHETDVSLKLTGDNRPKALHGKTNTCTSTMSTIKKGSRSEEFAERPSASLKDGGSHIPGFHSKAVALIPIFGANDPSNRENFILADLDSKEHVSPMAPCSILHSSAHVQDKHLYHKRQKDVAAATEARKRRRELTKLKNLHGRQLKLQC